MRVPLAERSSPGFVLKFKLGHCEIQIRPLGIKVGQYQRFHLLPNALADLTGTINSSLRNHAGKGVQRTMRAARRGGG
jgi:hypothetical protein